MRADENNYLLCWELKYHLSYVYILAINIRKYLTISLPVTTKQTRMSNSPGLTELIIFLYSSIGFDMQKLIFTSLLRSKVGLNYDKLSCFTTYKSFKVDCSSKSETRP